MESLFLMIPYHKGGENWKCLESHDQIFEETNNLRSSPVY